MILFSFQIEFDMSHVSQPISFLLIQSTLFSLSMEEIDFFSMCNKNEIETASAISMIALFTCEPFFSLDYRFFWLVLLLAFFLRFGGGHQLELETVSLSSMLFSIKRSASEKLPIAARLRAEKVNGTLKIV